MEGMPLVATYSLAQSDVGPDGRPPSFQTGPYVEEAHQVGTNNS